MDAVRQERTDDAAVRIDEICVLINEGHFIPQRLILRDDDVFYIGIIRLNSGVPGVVDGDDAGDEELRVGTESDELLNKLIEPCVELGQIEVLQDVIGANVQKDKIRKERGAASGASKPKTAIVRAAAVVAVKVIKNLIDSVSVVAFMTSLPRRGQPG